MPTQDKKCVDYAVSRSGDRRVMPVLEAAELRPQMDPIPTILRGEHTNPLFVCYLIFRRERVSLNMEVVLGRQRSLTRRAIVAGAHCEVTMNPQAPHLDSLWLIPPALAVAFMAWVLWCWWEEAHKH
jgi:hypothetical protein